MSSILRSTPLLAGKEMALNDHLTIFTGQQQGGRALKSFCGQSCCFQEGGVEKAFQNYDN